MKVNHFPIRHDLPLATTTFSHAVPHQFKKYLEREGWVAKARDDEVEIIHRTDTVIPVFKGAQRGGTTVIPFGREAYFAALSGWIRVQLRKAGYVISRGQAVHPNLNRMMLQTPRRATPDLNVHAHLQWEWEIEHHSGGHWLVIRPGRRYLSADTFASERLRGWLTDRPVEIQEAHAVNLVTGMSRRLTREQRQWRAPWETEHAGEWHLSFDMETLLTLNLSGHAADVSQFTMPELVNLVKKEVVWSEFVTTTEALDIPAHEVQGQKLKFGRGSGREVSDVLKYGILEQPAQLVRLAVIVPDLQDGQKKEQLKRELLAHLLPREMVLENTRARQGLEELRRKEGDDTLYTIWTENGRYQKLGLPAFDVAKGFHQWCGQF